MLLLIQKSTRILNLDSPTMTSSSLMGAFWRYSPPASTVGLLLSAGVFSGYPNGSYLFDTASYIGLAPLVAAAALLAICCIRKRRPDGRFLFLAVVGTFAFAAALPVFDFLRHLSTAVVMRSPARLFYVTTFSLAVALGAGVDAILTLKTRTRLAYAWWP